VVAGEPAEADVSIRGDAVSLFALAAGRLEPREALRSGTLHAEGDLDALVDFPTLFEIEPDLEPLP
jgi:predicted lipid carrier protein YhbT